MAPSSIIDLYQKKRLQVRWNKRSMELEVPVDVFSSHQLDRGTAFLIRHLRQRELKWERALDLGCGYGPILTWLAVTGRSKTLVGTERDWLAAEFAKRNAAQLGLEDVTIVPGLGYEGLQGSKFDLIVSNLPAKAGKPVHQSMLWGASQHLAPGGQVWLVVVSPLKEQIEEMLDVEGIEVFERIPSSQHTIFGYSVTGELPQVEDAYLRDTNPFEFDGIFFNLDTLYNLPDFDTYSYETELLLQGLSGYLDSQQPTSIAILNPTQGHLGAYAVARSASSVRRVSLVSRDMLAINAARRNLINCGFDGEIDELPGLEMPECPLDLVIGRLNEKEGAEIAAARVRQIVQRPEPPSLWLSCKRSFGDRLGRLLARESIRLGQRGKSSAYGIYSWNPVT